MDKYIDGQIYKQIEGLIDRLLDRKIDRQIDSNMNMKMIDWTLDSILYCTVQTIDVQIAYASQVVKTGDGIYIFKER